ncbi:hypothetical protein ACXR2W_13695 [Leucobacter sp. HY1908]
MANTSRVRAAGAVATVCVFLGTAALAPFSMTTAFALDGGAGGVPGARTAQTLQSTDATITELDTSIDGVEEAIAVAPGIGAAAQLSKASPAEYSLEEFLFSGVVNWSGYRFTFYSQQVLPGPGLAIPGRHVNAGGYVADEDGYIVLAGDHPKGAVFDTPFGYPGKIYDRGTFGNHLDVYIR